MAEDREAEVKGKAEFDFRIILVGLLLFLVAMGASYFVMRSLIAPLVPKAEKQEVTLSGNLMEVGEFTTNISSASGTRFLKVKVTIEAGSEDDEVQETLTKYMPVVQDSIIGILAAQSVADLDVRNRNNLKNLIKNDINAKLGGDLVKNVYFTDFIMQ